MSKVNGIRTLDETKRTRGEQLQQVVKFSESILPSTFSDLEENPLYGTDPHILSCVILMAVAVVLILSLDRFSSKK